MKRYDYIQFGALSVLSHIAQGAAFILLFAAFGGTGTTSSFTFATPVGLALGVVYVSALSFLFGWGLRPERGIDKNRCWNAAMALYVLNLASLLAHPTVLLSFGGGFGSIFGDGLGAAATACACGRGGVAFRRDVLCCPCPARRCGAAVLYTGAHPQREKACQIRRQRKFSRIFCRCGSGHNK